MRNSSLNKKVLNFWLLFGSNLSNENDNVVFTDFAIGGSKAYFPFNKQKFRLTSFFLLRCLFFRYGLLYHICIITLSGSAL